jgi:hypothetical protein
VNVYLRPTVGTATFITYKGSDNKMDDGFTEYSTCPVKEGERLMIKMQFREGVTETNNIPAPRFSITEETNVGSSSSHTVLDGPESFAGEL